MGEQTETATQRLTRMRKAILTMERALHTEINPSERHRLAQRIAAHYAGVALLMKRLRG